MYNTLNITDAQGLSFLQSQTHVLSNRAFDVKYDLINLAEFLPVNTDYPEWASGVEFQVGDVSGAAKWQSGYAKDVPMADVSLVSVTSAFAMYAVGYGYNVEEVGKAMHAGYPLTARKAVSARQAADHFTVDTAFLGGGHQGWSGLLNRTGVTPKLSPDNGTGGARNWFNTSGGDYTTGNKTPEQVVAEINGLITGGLVEKLGIIPSQLADTILVPSLAYKYMADTPYGITSPNKSILQYILENNVYTNRTGRPLVIRDLPYLAKAATASGVVGQGRIVAYRNNPDSIELPMPMPFRFLETRSSGALQWEVPGIGRVGQLIEISTGSIRYLDGVSPAPTT